VEEAERHARDAAADDEEDEEPWRRSREE
jgi:hypothetical protein